MLNSSMERSRQNILYATHDKAKELEDKTHRAETADRAKYWYPLAMRVQAITKAFDSYLEDLKAVIAKKGNLSQIQKEEIFNKIQQYRESIRSLDAKINSVFYILVFISPQSDSLKLNSKEFSSKFFEGKDGEKEKIFLTSLQNNIRINENNLVGFCNAQIGAFIDEIFSYSAIIGQNSTIFKPGEYLEIKTGMAEFRKDYGTRVEINRNQYQANDSGFVRVKIKCPDAPGQYILPIKLIFLNPITHKDESMTYIVKYEVLKL